MIGHDMNEAIWGRRWKQNRERERGKSKEVSNGDVNHSCSVLLCIVPPHILSQRSALLQWLEIQQQQNKLTQTLMSAVNLRESRRFEILRPERFDRCPDCPESWIGFYKQAAEYNEWKTDRDRIVNTTISCWTSKKMACVSFVGMEIWTMVQMESMLYNNLSKKFSRTTGPGYLLPLQVWYSTKVFP